QDAGRTLPLAEHGEKLLKVQLLPTIRDINDFMWPPRLQPVSQRSQVGRSVVEPSIAFADERGLDLELRVVLEEHRKRAFAFPCYSFGDQVLDQSRQARIVKTFPQCLIELYADPRVNGVEL